jgi:hypothetical protein
LRLSSILPAGAFVGVAADVGLAAGAWYRVERKVRGLSLHE